MLGTIIGYIVGKLRCFSFKKPLPQNMTKEEYLKKCGAKSAKDLTEQQILDFFILGYGGSGNGVSAMYIKEGEFLGFKLNHSKSMSMLRRAFEQDKIVRMVYVDGEGIVDKGIPIGTSHYEMYLE